MSVTSEHIIERINALRRKSAEIQSKDTPVKAQDRKFSSVSDIIRWWAATLIIVFYGFVLLAALVIFYRQGAGCPVGQTCAWADAAGNVLELLKIGIMPVITLVIGYYFGKNEK